MSQIGVGIETETMFVVSPRADRVVLEEIRRALKQEKHVIFNSPHQVDVIRISRLLQQVGFFPDVEFKRFGVTYIPGSRSMGAIPYPVGSEWTHSRKLSNVKWEWAEPMDHKLVLDTLRQFLASDAPIPDLEFPS